VEYAWLVGAVGVFSMIYAALVCMAQTDLKKLVAYSSVSHMGFVLLGLAAGAYAAPLSASQPVLAKAVIGVDGAIFQMFNHGLITAVLFMLCGSIKHKAHTRDIPTLRGIGARMPLFSFVLIVGFFASLGLPGLNGFISEFMVFAGTYYAISDYALLLLIPLITIPITGAYYVWTLHKMLLGDYNEELGELKDLNRHELLPYLVLLALIMLVGVMPYFVLQYITPVGHEVFTTLGGVIP
jgi:NADH-quinone oxidoreductase subunit M